jgi:uncharacterized protein YegL
MQNHFHRSLNPYWDRMRKLPIYFLLDSSPGMIGEPMWALQNYIALLISRLRCNPAAIESVSISVTLFNSKPEEVLQLTKLESIVLPIEFRNSMKGGLLNTGKAIDFFIKISEPEINRRKKFIYLHHKPVVFLITSGNPDDQELYNTLSKTLDQSEFGYKIGCCFNENNIIELKKFSNNIILLKSDSESIKQLMLWSEEFILTIINDDLGVFDSNETINPYHPTLPSPRSSLKFI